MAEASSSRSSSTEVEYVLLQHPPVWDLPSASIECIRLQAYLRLAVLPYRVENMPNQPDSELLPALERGDEVAYACVDDGPVGYLRERHNVDLDAALQAQEKAELHAFAGLVDSVLRDASLFELWMESQNAAAVRESYAAALPWPLCSVLAWQKQRTVKSYFRSKGLASRPEEVYSKAAAAYSALSVRLGNATQFFAERPSSLDAAVYAHLIFHLRAPLVSAGLKTKIEEYPNLVAFAEALHSKLFGDLPPETPPPFTRTQGQPKARARQAPGSEAKKDEKTLGMPQRTRYFLLAQAATIIGYVLLGTLSLQLEEGDVEDDDDDGEDD